MRNYKKELADQTRLHQFLMEGSRVGRLTHRVLHLYVRRIVQVMGPDSYVSHHSPASSLWMERFSGWWVYYLNQ
jgi:hypothetical protein